MATNRITISVPDPHDDDIFMHLPVDAAVEIAEVLQDRMPFIAMKLMEAVASANSGFNYVGYVERNEH